MPTSTADVTAPASYTIDSFDAHCTTSDVVKSLIKNGGCFVRGLIGRESIEDMVSQVQPYVDADVPWEGEFFPKETRRACPKIQPCATTRL